MEDIKLQSAKIHSFQEEKAINEQIDQLKEIADERELEQGIRLENRNPKAIDAKIAELEKLKRAHGVPQLSPVERSRALKEVEMLTEDLQKDMPTWDEYVSLTPKHGARYTALVRKIVSWENDPVRRQKVQRWKTLRRLIEPNDPMAASTMYLFPQ